MNNPTKRILKKFEEFLKEFEISKSNDVSVVASRTLLVSYEMIFARVPALILFTVYQVRSDEAKKALSNLSSKSSTDLKNLAQLLAEVLNKNPRMLEWGEQLQKIEKRMEPHRDFLDHLSFRASGGDQMLFTLFLLDKVERHFAGFFLETCKHRQGVTSQYFDALIEDGNDALLGHAFEAEYAVSLEGAEPAALANTEIMMEQTAKQIQCMVRDMFAPALMIHRFVM